MRIIIILLLFIACRTSNVNYTDAKLVNVEVTALNTFEITEEIISRAEVIKPVEKSKVFVSYTQDRIVLQIFYTALDAKEYALLTETLNKVKDAISVVIR